ncbi:MAG: LTA synthase family protein [Bacillota bacterium]|nr:LTA synthase family protein [Bacillota bacterium]
MISYSVFFIFELLLSELVFRYSVYSELNITPWLIAFVLVIALAAAFIASLLKGVIGKIFAVIVTAFNFIFYGTNLVYYHIFGTFLSITQYSQGADAVSNFFRETLLGIKESAVYIALLLIPIIVLIVLLKLKAFNKDYKIKHTFILLIASILIFVGSSLGIKAMPDINYGVKDIFYESFVLSLSEKDFGVMASAILETRDVYFGKGNTIVKQERENDAAEYSKKEYNVLDIDFDELSRSTQDVKYQSIDDYMADKVPTKKNFMTGKYKDYNVITLLCESFSPYVISKELTPTLYKLAKEGIQFTDYYNCNDNNTSNSEYSFLTSLMPDTTLFVPDGAGFEQFRQYNSCTASQKNYLPLTLANELSKRFYRTVFYHNYLASYYNRDLTHGNFGFDLVTMNDGLKYSPYWPTSDIDLMQQAVPDLIENYQQSKKPFYAYFLTFSGHMAYNFETNEIAAKNYEDVAELPYDDDVKAYLAGNIELEKAIKYMINELDKADMLDNTLIVLAPDHYPYGLGIGQLSQLTTGYLARNKNEMELNKHKGALLMWTASMLDEPQQVVDWPVSELDILPTLLNMLGIDYDSRLLMGLDAFADCNHIAMFDDRSFVTKDFYYNINTGDVVSRNGASTDNVDLEKYISKIKNVFAVSDSILYSDYYKHVFEK